MKSMGGFFVLSKSVKCISYHCNQDKLFCVVSLIISIFSHV